MSEIKIKPNIIKKCPHGKQKHVCKDCGGSAICKHGKIKYWCKECGGSAYCQHGILKAKCKECGGGALCKHGKRKAQCKECGGSIFCEHGKEKRRCKECDGSAYCKHGRDKYYCKECGGSALCEHGNITSRCKECGGVSICKHGKQKHLCKECGGASICEHGKIKYQCKECSGSVFCKHGKRKPTCKECGGSALCEHGKIKAACNICAAVGARRFCQICASTLLSTQRLRQNIKICAQCDTEAPQRTEHWIRDNLLKMGMFPPSAMDDTLFGGQECSMMNKKRRPDLMWVTNDDARVLIVEVDENSHLNSGYEPDCESAWMSDMADACGVLGKTAPHIIRFNPDAYDGGIVGINTRLEALYEKIEHFLTKPYESQNEPSVEYMYYHSSARKYIEHASSSGGIIVIN